MITHQAEKYGWEFIFMGANIDVASEGSRLGIKPGLAYSFDASQEGIEALYCCAMAAVDVARGPKKKKK